MQAGDIVRFKKAHIPEAKPGEATTPWNVGLLVEYHTWEKIATILYDGEVLRISAANVQLHTRAIHEDR
jgi:hypothetical protein